jgi:two-component system KDP operon response regulator KdpE
MDGRCVLAIECDWRIRKLIRANLEAVGLQVEEAVSGPHGLQLLGHCRPDLVLLDLDVPDQDTVHLLDALRLQSPDRTVAVVGLSAEPPGRGLLDRGQIPGCLQKPFSAEELMQQVRKALETVRDGE